MTALGAANRASGDRGGNLSALGIRYYATGHRKTAIAKVWLMPGGNGQIEVNNRSLSDYVRRPSLELLVNRPFDVTETVGQFSVKAKVQGGGISGQAGALRHGIARALLQANPDLRANLRQAGLLTRDSRVKERKKYGRKRARRGFQFSKR
ncbi:MAG: 30S ribosomal protein S9 [Armatimonadetes bacterium]|nr:30S ribosomal protein S9 [Armatimonadota bacterium]